MQLLVGKGLVHFIDGVGPEGERDGLAPVELLETPFEIGGITNLDVIWERRIRKDIDAVGVFHKAIHYCPEK